MVYWILPGMQVPGRRIVVRFVQIIDFCSILTIFHSIFSIDQIEMHKIG